MQNILKGEIKEIWADNGLKFVIFLNWKQILCVI